MIIMEQERIKELKRQIKKLPTGYISKKTIRGKIYFYYQWTENGKKKVNISEMMRLNN